MSNYLDEVRVKIVNTAAGMLDGSINFIVGSRLIADLSGVADLRNDPDVEPFVLIESETETLPVEARVRSLWRPDALDKLQPEIDSAESWAREVGLQHCENLIARLGKR